jgi:hypothetical protein
MMKNPLYRGAIWGRKMLNTKLQSKAAVEKHGHRQFGLPGCSPETKKGAKHILTKDFKNAEVNGSHEVSDARGRRDFDWIGPCE